MKKIIIGVVIAIILIFGIAKCASSGTSSNKISMPNVYGQSLTDAESTLKNAGIKSTITAKTGIGTTVVVGSSGYTVTAQDPVANTEIGANDKITLTVQSDAEVAAAQKKADQEVAAAATKAATASDEATVKSLVGSSSSDAQSKLSALGYTVTYKHAVSLIDYTDEVKSDDIQWVITKYDSFNYSKKTVTLYVNTQTNIDAQTAKSAQESALNSKLSSSAAWSEAKDYGKLQYPYGFDLHNIVGLLAQTAVDDNTWFLKATCDVTNSFGAKQKDLTCEAKVTGTTNNPQIISFIVY